jgi:hypothetical protein
MHQQLFGFKRLPMPDECPDCGHKMSRVQYSNKYWSKLHGSASSRRFFRECDCGCLIVWSYPNVFKRQHILPIFNTLPDEILGEA